MGLGMFTDYYECRDGLWYVDGCKIWEQALPGSDDEAISSSFASLTPLSLNPTDHIELNRVQALLASVAQ
jgi:5'-nucleotidase